MAVDAGMRKLHVPPRFLPYLEKHRIYELFHDLGNQLAMNRPDDPLSFLKLCLERVGENRDKRLIILLAPPYMDTIKLAHLLSVKTGCGILSRYMLSLKSGDFFDSHALAETSANLIKESDKEGWILADYPSNVEEAKLLIKSGVIPTHTFMLVPEEQGSTALSCYEKEEQEHKEYEKLRQLDITPSMLTEFDNRIQRMKELFSPSLKIVKTNDKDLTEVANACARLTMTVPVRHAPKLFRLVLIGPRGSRRRTVAKILSRRYNLVHVDIDYLISVGQIMENDLGDEIRRLDANNSLYPTRIVFELLKNRLNKQDCLESGYVLTSFPTCVEDFVLLDSMDTPPNRVIFLDITGDDCQERLEDRVVNEFSGKLYSKKSIANDKLLKSQTHTHPNDEACKVKEEVKFYNKTVRALKDYCGNTSWTVDARGPITSLVERVEGVLMSSSPAAQPRSRALPRRHSIKEYVNESQPQESNKSTEYRLSYPVSKTDIVPLIDSDDMIKRYEELKSGGYDQRNESMLTSFQIMSNVDKISENKELTNNLPTIGSRNSGAFNGNNVSSKEFQVIMSHTTTESICSVSSGPEAF